MAGQTPVLVVVAIHHYIKDRAQADLALQMRERYLVMNLGHILKQQGTGSCKRTSA